MQRADGSGQSRRTISYANVVSTLALVLALGGGSALAAGSLTISTAHKQKPKPAPKLTLNSADKAFIAAEIKAGHVAFAETAGSAANAASAATAANAATATNATNATNAQTAANTLALGGTPASEFTHRDCASITGQIKGFVDIPEGTDDFVFTSVGGYNCSGRAIEVETVEPGVNIVRFVGSPATIALATASSSGLGTVARSVSVHLLAPGEFEVGTWNIHGEVDPSGFELLVP